MRFSFACLLALAGTLSAQTVPQAKELRRFPAEEADQGVATDARFFYAIDDYRIGKYRKADGVRVAQWQGKPPAFIHINSCTVVAAELVCAMSNYPGVPHTSSIERFRTSDLHHTGTHSFGPGRGSLVWVEQHAGSWFACFANYDGKGGEPPRDHRSTVLVRFNSVWAEQESWLFPEDVLESFGHMSASGGRFGAGGLLYVQGHDLPEMYVLRIPSQGGRLEHVSTIGMPTGGQAFDWDRPGTARVWTISRKGKEVVESEMP